MNVVVFCGPSVPAEVVARTFRATVRPPAQRGDVLSAALGRPAAIALIDGYFDRVPSVWHKEILWAMAQGIHVFGASSMGALRAAELAAFGMVGVGEIFAAFARGDLEDDDEVAVAHGDAASGFRACSEAMVNIRATLRAAQAQGVIAERTSVELCERAKALPYDRRDLRAVLACPAAGLDVREVTRLLAWLPHGRVDQKRADAMALLHQLAELDRAGWPERRANFLMAETDPWIALRNRTEEAHDARALEPGLEQELRAQGLLGEVLVAATMRLLAERRLRQNQVQLNARAVEASIDDFRRERELLSAESFDVWLERSGLGEEQQQAFFRREAVVRATKAELRHMLGAAVEDELRASGRLEQLKTAALRKASLLDGTVKASPSPEDLGVNEDELWRWYFCQHLRVEVPPSLTFYAASEGSSIDELRTAALREYALRSLEDGTATTYGHGYPVQSCER
jgi:hypothetical protein